MANGYSEDFRLAAIRCVESGRTQGDVAVLFGISLKTLSNWLRQWKQEGSVHVHPRKPYRKQSVCRERLTELLKETPDATLQELADVFDTVPSVIHYHLSKMHVTRKKNRAVSGAGRGSKDKI